MTGNDAASTESQNQPQGLWPRGLWPGGEDGGRGEEEGWKEGRSRNPEGRGSGKDPAKVVSQGKEGLGRKVRCSPKPGRKVEAGPPAEESPLGPGMGAEVNEVTQEAWDARKDHGALR